MRAFHGRVSDTNDLQSQGRVRVQIYGFEQGADLTPFCRPLLPAAGDGYGDWIPLQVGDEVVVMEIDSGDWVVLGCHWSGRKAPPDEAAADHRILKTPGGHVVDLHEDGDITITNSGGASIEVKADGKVHVNGGDQPILLQNCPCQYTGSPHGLGSTKVKAGD